MTSGLLFNMESNSIHVNEERVIRKPILLMNIIFVVLLSVGMLIPELLIGRKYEGEISKEVFLEKLTSKNLLEEASIVEEMAEDPQLVFIHTKAFYPRYYEPGMGEPGDNIEWLLAKDSGNLGFMIMSPNVTGVTFSIEELPMIFPHNSEAYIMGKWLTSEIAGKYLIGKLIFLPEYDLIIEANKIQ